MKRIYVSTKGVEDWKSRLADSEKHWKVGYSSYALAHLWESVNNARGLPKPVAQVLDAHAELQDAELLLALPEHKVALPGGGFDSQCDLWALLSTEKALISLSVEGKAGEPFGERVGKWLNAGTGANSVTNRRERLRGLCDLLGLTPASDFADIGELRYQLFHRTASAILEARRFHANHAVMLVQNFGEVATTTGHRDFADFQAFCEHLGAPNMVPGVLARATSVDDGKLWLGWIDCPLRPVVAGSD